MKNGDLASRFLSKVNVNENGCWLWLGEVNPKGFGIFHIGQKKHYVLAHRWAYEFYTAPVGENTLRQSCGVRHCVNPEHQELTGCKQGKPRKESSDIREKFLSHVEVQEDGCWHWKGRRRERDHGYGQYKGGNRKYTLAHRFSYELFKGPIPPGLVVDHLCRVRHCVNPDHLECVTSRENSLRGYIYRTWTNLYRDLYREVFGDQVTEEDWMTDALRRKERLNNSQKEGRKENHDETNHTRNHTSAE